MSLRPKNDCVALAILGVYTHEIGTGKISSWTRKTQGICKMDFFLPKACLLSISRYYIVLHANLHLRHKAPIACGYRPTMHVTPLLTAMCLHLPLVPPAGTRSDHLYLRYHRVVERRRLGGLCRHVGLHHYPHLLHFLPDRHLLPAARPVDAHRKSRCLYRLV